MKCNWACHHRSASKNRSADTASCSACLHVQTKTAAEVACTSPNQLTISNSTLSRKSDRCSSDFDEFLTCAVPDEAGRKWRHAVLPSRRCVVMGAVVETADRTLSYFARRRCHRRVLPDGRFLVLGAALFTRGSGATGQPELLPPVALRLHRPVVA